MRTTVTPTEIGGGISHVIAVDGQTLMGVTEETGMDKINHAVELVRAREDEIATALKAAEAMRSWNIVQLDRGKQGKDWPEFRAVDRVRKQICQQANIVDS